MGVPISDRAAFLTRVYIAANTVLLALCLVAFSTRIYHRVRPTWHVGLDDYFITAGFVRFPIFPYQYNPRNINIHNPTNQ